MTLSLDVKSSHFITVSFLFRRLCERSHDLSLESPRVNDCLAWFSDIVSPFTEFTWDLNFTVSDVQLLSTSITSSPPCFRYRRLWKVKSFSKSCLLSQRPAGHVLGWGCYPFEFRGTQCHCWETSAWHVAWSWRKQTPERRSIYLHPKPVSIGFHWYYRLWPLLLVITFRS